MWHNTTVTANTSISDWVPYHTCTLPTAKDLACRCNGDITQTHMYMTKKHLTPHTCPTLSTVAWACHIDLGLWLHVPQRQIKNDTCPDMDSPELTSTATCLTETKPRPIQPEVWTQLHFLSTSGQSMCSMNSAVCMQTWKACDESNSVDLQRATFLTYPFFPHIGTQSHFLDDMCQTCHNICSSIT